MTWEQDLPRRLAPWNLSQIRLAGELTGLGDRSRVWRIEAEQGTFAAKLTFDGPPFVEPGLRIAEALDQAGIQTGAPRPTADGRLGVAVDRPDGHPYTLALHRFVPGSPLDWSTAAAADQVGDLLGQVHAALSARAGALRPGGNLIAFYTGEAARLGGGRGAGLARALDALARFHARTPLADGIVYGDPAPEILQPGTGAPLALIDWGTPSWGPLLFDLVSWQLFLSAHQPPHRGAEGDRRVLEAYRARQPISDAELRARSLVVDLHRAIQRAWAPTPPADA